MSRKCDPGCNCGRHRQRRTAAYRKCDLGCNCGRHVFTPEHRAKLGRPGVRKSPEHAAAIKAGTAGRPKPWLRGRRSNGWRGDDIGYATAHHRVRSMRGRASEHDCACGEPAESWAFAGDRTTALRETVTRNGKSWDAPYSPDPSDYIALCWLCHGRHDRAAARLDRERLSNSPTNPTASGDARSDLANAV